MLSSPFRAPYRAVALSEEVSANKPISVSVDAQPLVLWRDATGTARVLEDRCPHRRAPLSLGCVREDGNLRCGYHGWLFNGSGQVVDIPQMRDQGRVPSLYRAARFALIEEAGFIFVDVSKAADTGIAAASPLADVLPHHAVTYSPLGYDRLIELLLDGPHLLITIPGIRISEYPLADPERREGRIVCERACRRRGGILPDRLRAELPYALRLEIEADTGLTLLTLRDDKNRQLLEAVLSLVPARRGATAIRWRARAARRGVPLRIVPCPDGRQVESLLKDASTILDDPARTAPVATPA